MTRLTSGTRQAVLAGQAAEIAPAEPRLMVGGITLRAMPRAITEDLAVRRLDALVRRGEYRAYEILLT